MGGDSAPTDPFTSMAEGAASMHELYLTWIAAGFTADQSIYLIGVVLSSSLRSGPAQP